MARRIQPDPRARSAALFLAVYLGGVAGFGAVMTHLAALTGGGFQP